MCEIGAAHVGVSKIGLAHVGREQVRASDIRISEVGITQVGQPNECAAEVGIEKLCPLHVCGKQISALQVGVIEEGVAQIRAGQIRTAQVSFIKKSIRQIGVDEAGAPEVGAGKIRVPQGGSCEIGIAELGASEISIGKIDAIEDRKGKVDVAQVSTVVAEELKCGLLADVASGGRPGGDDLPSVNQMGTLAFGAFLVKGDASVAELKVAKADAGDRGDHRGGSENLDVELHRGQGEEREHRLCMEHRKAQGKHRGSGGERGERSHNKVRPRVGGDLPDDDRDANRDQHHRRNDKISKFRHLGCTFAANLLTAQGKSVAEPLVLGRAHA